MTWKECKSLIWQDLSRSTKKHTKKNLIKFLLTNASFKITFWFRIGSYFMQKNKLLYFFVFLLYKQLMYKTGIQLPLGTFVRGGLRFYHFSNVVINAKAIIGKNVSIYNGVTIGINLSPHGSCSPPVIGDNVVICTGAKIIGNVTIGDSCVIGANAVVVKDLPKGSIAAGIPAKILSDKGSMYTELYVNHM